jgi:hypothetical protein
VLKTCEPSASALRVDPEVTISEKRDLSSVAEAVAGKVAASTAMMAPRPRLLRNFIAPSSVDLARGVRYGMAIGLSGIYQIVKSDLAILLGSPPGAVSRHWLAQRLQLRSALSAGKLLREG